MVAVLLLAGCSSAPQSAAPSDPAPASSAPLVAESPAATSDAGEAAYLAAVREALRPDTQIPNATDEQLLEVGQRACEELNKGTDTTELSLIEGEQPNDIGTYNDSAAIITSAATTIC
jgi:hypothetical protein